MTCEELRQQLPDHTLGTLSETEMKAVRRHLRGCSGCRAEAALLDEGVSLFASAAHEADPPPELRDRVMSVLAEEWSERPASARLKPPRSARWQLAVAASVVLLAGLLVWGGAAQGTASRFREDATSYRQFLQALGGRDVRVSVLLPESGSVLEGSAVLYDSDHGQSWVLVIVRAPGKAEPMDVTLTATDGRSIKLPFPLKPDAEGEASTWLVTPVDITSYVTVRITDSATGQLLGTGTVVNHDH